MGHAAARRARDLAPSTRRKISTVQNHVAGMRAYWISGRNLNDENGCPEEPVHDSERGSFEITFKLRRTITRVLPLQSEPNT